MAHSWPDFTAALRELFTWCGRPKYATLSKASGLAPSNISNLIGKNPLQRPSQAAALRFVEACLTIGGYSPRAVQDSLEEWREAWAAIETGNLPALPPAAPEPAGPLAEPPRRRRPFAALVVAAAVGAVSVAAAGGTWLVWRAEASDGSSHGAADAPGLARCKASKISPTTDVRTTRTWSEVFVCPNDVGARIRLEPSLNSPVIGTLDYDSSWFVCWADGEEHTGHNRIWYYTKGDSVVSDPAVDKWGYVPASDLNTDQDPDPNVSRECPA